MNENQLDLFANFQRNDNESFIYLIDNGNEEINNKTFLQKKRSSSFGFLNESFEEDSYQYPNNNLFINVNNIKSLVPEENGENPFNHIIKSNNNNNKPELIINKFLSEEIKTKEASNNKSIEKNSLNNIINVEQIIPEIKRNNRDDNDRVKIKLVVSKSYVELFNKNVKDENLKIKNFDFNKFKKILISNDSLLGETKWKYIILNNYNGNKIIINNLIKNIFDKNEKESIKLLEMTFQEYLEIFKKNNLELFLENERKSQIKKYEQKKYKEVIDKEISRDNIENLKNIKNYVIFGVKNKNIKKALEFDNIEENTIKNFKERNYKISKEKKFISFINLKYGEINFELTSNEKNDIDDYIKHLRDLVENFNTWFKDKSSRKSRKKMFRVIFH